MTSILIASYPSDIHATVVAEAIAARGHQAVLWQGADFPTRQVATINIENNGACDWEVRGPRLSMTSALPFDVVWYRRPVIEPVLPEEMHPGDRIVAQRECSLFMRNLWQLVACDAYWVNPLGSRQRATAKVVQLKEAVSAGLQIPPTICTNDPARIRSFLDRYDRQVIYKPFYPAQWRTNDGAFQLFTSSLAQDDLPDDDILRLTPGIFQQRIPKYYELRLTYIGDYLVPAKLPSQEIAGAQVDWKLAFANLRVLHTQIPSAVDQACRRLLKSLGLVFACIDMIVTPSEDYVFLELNEMGQFLWLEELNPDLLLLDPFCEFLMQARPDFSWRRSPENLCFAKFHDVASKKQHETLERVHVRSHPRVSVEE